MSSKEPLEQREKRKRRREAWIILLLSCLFVFLTIAEFQLSKFSRTLPFVNSIFFFGLLNFNLVILIALAWLVFRNIGKVFLERRQRLLGSRLKTKLVIAFLAFSIIPTLVLFIISAMYINSSFDKWFSLKVQNTLQASLEITRTFYRNADQTAMHFAEHLAKGVGAKLAGTQKANGARIKIPPLWVEGYLGAQRELLALDSVEFYVDPLEGRIFVQRETIADVKGKFPGLSLDILEKAFSGEKVSIIQHLGNGDLLRCVVPVRESNLPAKPVSGVLVVSSYIPVSLVNKVDEIASVFDDYKDTNPLKYPMKTTYFVILILITLVILFVAIWIGLYMARELTVPLERLVHGAEEVGGGNLNVVLSAGGNDEISTLIESFNKMTSDLRDNQARLTQASADLERRRIQLEAILANIGAGVLSVDSAGNVSTFNPALSKMLKIDANFAIGRNYRAVLNKDAAPLVEALDRAFANPVPLSPFIPNEVQWNYSQEGVSRVFSSTLTPLRENENHWGFVVVIDDMTHLVKGQREMAWREVARRIAHEIKNPLTPIKLSAQRLQRRMGHVRGTEGALLQECTETIIRHTDELKEMVNEFSSFARMPEASPSRNDLNMALQEVIVLYQQAHPQIFFRVLLEPRLPPFEFDREQIKRVAINLLDNAVSALAESSSTNKRQIRMTTHYNEQLNICVIEVEDNGPGMTEEVKAKVFEPYFSTKTEGTGLGLAIVKRVINDHDGFIRVFSSPGGGTRFLIELPISAKRVSYGQTSSSD